MAVDREGALDDGYLAGVGLDVDNERFERVGTSSIGACSAAVNTFIRNYRDAAEETPSVILVDSLDMLFTDGEQKAIEGAGELGGDMGQRAKQLKRMLMTWVNAVSKLNMHFHRLSSLKSFSLR